MSFVVGGISSNPVVIDVTGTVTMAYAPTNNYYPPVSNYPGYNPYSALDRFGAVKAYQKLYNYDSSDWQYWANLWLNDVPHYLGGIERSLSN